MKHTLYGQDDPSDAGGTAAPAASLGIAPNGLSSMLFLTEPGTQYSADMSDVHQGQMGDCYFDAAMMEEARFGPGFITNACRQLADGTVNVRLFVDASTGGAPTWGSTSFRPIMENVNPRNMVSYGNNSQAGQAQVGTQQEKWPAVFEQAYAQLMGGIPAIANGGWAFQAQETLSGNWATTVSPTTFNWAQLSRFISGNMTIAMDTNASGPLRADLVPWHSYAFEGATYNAGHGGMDTTIKLGNPWGSNYNPAPIKLSEVAANFSYIEIGHA